MSNNNKCSKSPINNSIKHGKRIVTFEDFYGISYFLRIMKIQSTQTIVNLMKTSIHLKPSKKLNAQIQSLITAILYSKSIQIVESIIRDEREKIQITK